jgi:hypothetical protein
MEENGDTVLFCQFLLSLSTPDFQEILLGRTSSWSNRNQNRAPFLMSLHSEHPSVLGEMEKENSGDVTRCRGPDNGCFQFAQPKWSGGHMPTQLPQAIVQHLPPSTSGFKDIVLGMGGGFGSLAIG